MSKLLYDRKYSLFVIPSTGDDARVLKDLHIRFNIQKTLSSATNTCELQIFNPSKDTIGLLSAKYTKIALNAGYGEDIRLVFKGEVQNLVQSKTSVDRIITVYCRDGFSDYKYAHFSKTFDTGIDMQNIVTEVINEFIDIIPGDISGIPKNRDKTNGVTLDGPVSRILDDVSNEYDADWSIQDGVVNIVGKENTLNDQELVLLSATSGMVGSPRVTEIGADVTTLLNVNLIPGARFTIQAISAEVQLGNLFFKASNKTRTEANGIYKVLSVNIRGDNREGNEWYSVVQGQRLGQ